MDKKSVTIASALLKAQMEMGNAVKDSANPIFKSKYADLNSIREACMPALNKNGIVVLQPTVVENGKNYVKTLLLHESGESMECLTEIVFSKQNDAQAQGSGITYARRYGLQSFVNVGADDDDGHKASQPAQTTKATTMNLEQAKALLDTAKDLDNLKALFISLPKETQKQAEAYKNELKVKLTPVTA